MAAMETTPVDNTLRVVTPENVAFEYRVAGPFRRLPAYAIDLAIRVVILGVTLGVLLILVAVTSIAVGSLVDGPAFFIFLLTWFLLSWFYGGLFECYWNGQTPGKRLMGLRVVTIEGQPINALQAIMRNVLRFADGLPIYTPVIPEGPLPFFIPTFFVGAVVAMISPRYQRLGDIACGTIVIIEQQSWLHGVARVKEPEVLNLASKLPANYEVSRSLGRVLADYVERRRFFPPGRRADIARHVGEPLRERFALPRETSHDLLLCAMYHRAFIATTGSDDGAPVFGDALVSQATPTQANPKQANPFLTDPAQAMQQASAT